MSRFQTFNYTDKQDDGITIRNPQSAYLLIDSIDRYNKNADGSYDSSIETNPNNILINHQRTLGAGQIKRIAVTELSLPFVSPNVNARNNKLYLNDESGNYWYIEVDEDFYTPSELASEINTILNKQGWINYSTDVPDISFNAPWSVKVDKCGRFIFIADISGVNYTFDPPVAVSNLAPQMNLQGIESQYVFDPVDTSDNGLYFIGGIPSMAYTKYIDVCSKTLTKFQNLKDSLTQLNYSDILCRIYLDNDINTPTSDTSRFTTRPCLNIHRTYANPKYILWNENEMITSIDIQLYDDRGNLLYIPEEEWDNNYYITIHMSES